MILLNNSNLDEDIPTATEPILDKQDNQPLAETLNMIYKKQQKTDGFVEGSPGDTISNSKDPPSFVLCDESNKLFKI